jgi:hypothetical protein
VRGSGGAGSAVAVACIAPVRIAIHEVAAGRAAARPAFADAVFDGECRLDGVRAVPSRTSVSRRPRSFPARAERRERFEKASSM